MLSPTYQRQERIPCLNSADTYANENVLVHCLTENVLTLLNDAGDNDSMAKTFRLRL